MRGLVAFLCGVLALIAGLVTVPIAWAGHNLANEDGYVAFTEPLATNFGPMAKFAIVNINQQMPFQLSVPNQLIVTVGGDQQTQVVDQIRKTPAVALNGLLMTGLLMVLSLFMARRRGMVLAWLGAGTMTVAGIAYLAFYCGVAFIAGRNTATSVFGPAMMDALVERSRASFGH